MTGIVDDGGDDFSGALSHAPYQYRIIGGIEQIQPADIPPRARVDRIAIERQPATPVRPAQDRLAGAGLRLFNQFTAHLRNRRQIRLDEFSTRSIQMPLGQKRCAVRVRRMKDQLLASKPEAGLHDGSDLVSGERPEHQRVQRNQDHLVFTRQVSEQQATG